MKQSVIDRCVARKTGESRRTISRHGFSLLEDEPADRVDEVSISVECDGRSRSVSLAVAQYGATEPEAACDVVDALFAMAADELFAIDTTSSQHTPSADDVNGRHDSRSPQVSRPSGGSMPDVQ